MGTTVPDTPDTGLVDDFVAQLRGAGVDTSDRAVRVLAMHARRRDLTRSQLVQVLAAFTHQGFWDERTQGYWDERTRAAALRLLTDMGDRMSPFELGFRVAMAAGVLPEVLESFTEPTTVVAEAPAADDTPTAELGRTIPPYGELPESVRRFRAEQNDLYERETGTCPRCGTRMRFDSDGVRYCPQALADPRHTGAGEPASGLLPCGCVAAVVRDEGEHHLGCTGGDF